MLRASRQSAVPGLVPEKNSRGEARTSSCMQRVLAASPDSLKFSGRKLQVGAFYPRRYSTSEATQSK